MIPKEKICFFGRLFDLILDLEKCKFANAEYKSLK